MKKTLLLLFIINISVVSLLKADTGSVSGTVFGSDDVLAGANVYLIGVKYNF